MRLDNTTNKIYIFHYHLNNIYIYNNQESRNYFRKILIKPKLFVDEYFDRWKRDAKILLSTTLERGRREKVKRSKRRKRMKEDD